MKIRQTVLPVLCPKGDEACSTPDRITILEDKIAWESDKTYKFKNTKDSLPAGKTW